MHAVAWPWVNEEVESVRAGLTDFHAIFASITTILFIFDLCTCRRFIKIRFTSYGDAEPFQLRILFRRKFSIGFADTGEHRYGSISALQKTRDAKSFQTMILMKILYIYPLPPAPSIHSHLSIYVCAGGVEINILISWNKSVVYSHIVLYRRSFFAIRLLSKLNMFVAVALRRKHLVS